MPIKVNSQSGAVAGASAGAVGRNAPRLDAGKTPFDQFFAAAKPREEAPAKPQARLRTDDAKGAGAAKKLAAKRQEAKARDSRCEDDGAEQAPEDKVGPGDQGAADAPTDDDAVAAKKAAQDADGKAKKAAKDDGSADDDAQSQAGALAQAAAAPPAAVAEQVDTSEGAEAAPLANAGQDARTALKAASADVADEPPAAGADAAQAGEADPAIAALEKNNGGSQADDAQDDSEPAAQAATDGKPAAKRTEKPAADAEADGALAAARLGDAPKAKGANAAKTARADDLATANAAGRAESAAAAQAVAVDDAHPGAKPATAKTDGAGEGVPAVGLPSSQGTGAAAGAKAAASPPPPPAPARDADFVQNNHEQIISTVHGQLLPHGGSMQIRLDPPELGALQVQVEVRDGVVTASFQTDNDQATRVLGHTLDQLRTSLEAQGVSVDKLQVKQGPKNDQPGSQPGDSRQSQGDALGQRQEQQRREVLQRMWRRLMGSQDPLDLVA